MTDDLVKRLRARITHSDSGKTSWPDALCDEAADRIEKLEGALRKISREHTLWGAMRKAQHALGEFDRKALEGKDD